MLGLVNKHTNSCEQSLTRTSFVARHRESLLQPCPQHMSGLTVPIELVRAALSPLVQKLQAKALHACVDHRRRENSAILCSARSQGRSSESASHALLDRIAEVGRGTREHILTVECEYTLGRLASA